MKMFMKIMLSMLIAGSVSSAAFGMITKTETETETEAKETETAEAKELSAILTEIRVIQYSCGYIGILNHLVPHRYKRYTLPQLQNKQRALFPRMRELSAMFSDEQLKIIIEEAEHLADSETDVIGTSEAALIRTNKIMRPILLTLWQLTQN